MKDFPIIRIDNFYDFSKGENTRVKNKVINQIKRAEWDNNYALEKNKFTTKLYNTFVDTAKKNLKFKVS